MKSVLFTDDSKALLDDPGDWAKGWAFGSDSFSTEIRL